MAEIFLQKVKYRIAEIMLLYALLRWAGGAAGDLGGIDFVELRFHPVSFRFFYSLYSSPKCSV